MTCHGHMLMLTRAPVKTKNKPEINNYIYGMETEPIPRRDESIAAYKFSPKKLYEYNLIWNCVPSQ